MNVKEEEYFHNQQILPRKIHSFHSHQHLIHIYIYIYIYIYKRTTTHI